LERRRAAGAVPDRRGTPRPPGGDCGGPSHRGRSRLVRARSV